VFVNDTIFIFTILFMSCDILLSQVTQSNGGGRIGFESGGAHDIN